MAACRAEWAEWAGWICRNARAARVQTALMSRLYAENSKWRRVLARLQRIDANVTPSYSRQVLSPAKREALFLGRCSRTPSPPSTPTCASEQSPAL
jgi:hypothetical protein